MALLMSIHNIHFMEKWSQKSQIYHQIFLKTKSSSLTHSITIFCPIVVPSTLQCLEGMAIRKLLRQLNSQNGKQFISIIFREELSQNQFTYSKYNYTMAYISFKYCNSVYVQDLTLSVFFSVFILLQIPVST